MEKNKIFFSIVTPTYNRAHTLKRVFESLQSQTYANFEWIVGDDGSTDDTEFLIKELKQNSSFSIRYYKYDHTGKAGTLRKIYYQAKGDYISVLDSDDRLYDEYVLQKLNGYITDLDSNINFWGVCGMYKDQHGDVYSKFNEPYIDITKQNFFDMLTNNPSLLNIKWVHKKGLFKIYDHSDIKEFLPYYPEVVDFVQNVLESEDYYYRLFNFNMIDYTLHSVDSVSLMQPSLMYWYEVVGMINLFYQYNLYKKYPSYTRAKLSVLSRNIYKQKGFLTTLKSLVTFDAKINFLLQYISPKNFIRQIFSIKNEYPKGIKRKVITILGLKMKFKVSKTHAGVKSNPSK